MHSSFFCLHKFERCTSICVWHLLFLPYAAVVIQYENTPLSDFACPSIPLLSPPLHLSTPTASVNNVLTFCLLVPKPSTSLKGLQACLEVQALSSHAALATTVASEFQWREWKGDISHNAYPAITRCSIQHGCRECSFFLLQLFYDDLSDKLFRLQIHLFELLLNSKLIQVGCPLHSLPLFYLFLPLSLLLFLHLPSYPAMLPLVFPPPPPNPMAANRRALSSPPIRGTRPPLRDGDASSLPERSPYRFVFLSLHHSVYLWVQASGVLAW